MLFLLFTLIATTAHAYPNAKVTVQDLHTGDVLLQSIPCYQCRLIELEEGLNYSHAAVVLKTSDSVQVLESWNDVQRVELNDFVGLRRKNSKTLVLRPVASNGQALVISSEPLLTYFQRGFLGHHYDDAYLWNNRDAQGELYYCSEFVAKLLNPFLPTPFQPKPMHYLKYRNDWIQFFHGTPPDGLPGISPADFARAPQLKIVGEL